MITTSFIKDQIKNKDVKVSFKIYWYFAFFFFIQQPSTFAKARQIIKSDGVGLSGLNKGLPATLGRHGVFNMIYFGFYFNVKNIIPVHNVSFLLC